MGKGCGGGGRAARGDNNCLHLLVIMPEGRPSPARLDSSSIFIITRPRDLLRYRLVFICHKMCTNALGHIQSVYNVYNRYTMVLGPPWRPRDRVYTMYRPPVGHIRPSPRRAAGRFLSGFRLPGALALGAPQLQQASRPVKRGSDRTFRWSVHRVHSLLWPPGRS